jgi:hypothetical protein
MKYIKRIKKLTDEIQQMNPSDNEHICNIVLSVVEMLGDVAYDLSKIDAAKEPAKDSKECAFVRHIENHLKDMEGDLKVACKICNKTIDEIYEEADNA